jgi:hypothetical protein
MPIEIPWSNNLEQINEIHIFILLLLKYIFVQPWTIP